MPSKKSHVLVSPARRAAFNILRRVEEEGAYASVLVASLPEPELSREDRGLAQEIALGVIRWQKTLDHFIERYSDRPVNRLDPAVLIALRMGLYQLRYLTRIPASAAVNESVNLVKAARATSAAGMVNAVLRKAARQVGDGPGDGIADSLERMAVEVSHPRWMLERWVAGFGREEARALAIANNDPPLIAFRINTLRAAEDEVLTLLRSDGVVTRQSEIAPGAIVVESGPGSAVVRAADTGLIYIQDEASQLVSLLLAPQRGERVLDLCAAPGSKSSHIAALAGDDCRIVACDIHPQRLAQLTATCRRLGAHSIDAVALDATRDLPFAGESSLFNRVLLDAPCTGTGTLRRNPEIKWRLEPSDPARLAAMQTSLLMRAADSVIEGGMLVYSTCSIEPEENEGVIARFLEHDSRFSVTSPAVASALVTKEGFVRTFPHRDKADGFFAAVLERR